MFSRTRGRQLSKHVTVGKDYTHAAQRKADGEASLRPRITGTLRYPMYGRPDDLVSRIAPALTDG